MKRYLIGFIVFNIIFIGSIMFFTLTPIGKSLFNKYDYAMNKVDEGTYQNQKEVEDTCRAYIASYTNDKLIYEQYKNSVNTTEIETANNAKTRANTTASTYNNYILKNKYIWKDNIPSDIYMQLEYLV